jgi:hypothetical protein
MGTEVENTGKTMDQLLAEAALDENAAGDGGEGAQAGAGSASESTTATSENAQKVAGQGGEPGEKKAPPASQQQIQQGKAQPEPKQQYSAEEVARMQADWKRKEQGYRRDLFKVRHKARGQETIDNTQLFEERREELQDLFIDDPVKAMEEVTKIAVEQAKKATEDGPRYDEDTSYGVLVDELAPQGVGEEAVQEAMEYLQELIDDDPTGAIGDEVENLKANSNHPWRDLYQLAQGYWWSNPANRELYAQAVQAQAGASQGQQDPKVTQQRKEQVKQTLKNVQAGNAASQIVTMGGGDPRTVPTIDEVSREERLKMPFDKLLAMAEADRH